MADTDRDPGFWEIPTAAAPQTVAIPQVNKQTYSTNLGAGAVVDFDFSIDTGPIFDMFLFADQVLQVFIYIRTGPTDTFRLLNSDVAAGLFASGVAGALKQIMNGQRFPGSQVRVEVQNNSGTPTTALDLEITARSM